MHNRLLIEKELAGVFNTLSHPDRIRIIENLRIRELSVNSLSETMSLPPTRVSQHLAQMRMQGLVEGRRKGRCMIYSLTQQDLAHWITDGLQFVESRATAGKITKDMIGKARRSRSRNQ